MKNQLDIPISLETIRKGLATAMKHHSYAELIAEIIVDNLSTTEKGVGQLVLAFMGEREIVNWQIGDEALLPLSKIYSWESDIDTMRREKLLEGEHVRCKVRSIDLTRKNSITVQYQGADAPKAGTPVKIKTVSGSFPPDVLVRMGQLAVGRPQIGDLL